MAIQQPPTEHDVVEAAVYASHGPEVKPVEVLKHCDARLGKSVRMRPPWTLESMDWGSTRRVTAGSGSESCCDGCVDCALMLSPQNDVKVSRVIDEDEKGQEGKEEGEVSRKDLHEADRPPPLVCRTQGGQCAYIHRILVCP